LKDNRNNERDTSWNKVAGWYDQHVSVTSDHHHDLIIPGVLDILKPKKGEKMLDLGCGQGIFSFELARRGVQVVGIDSSKKLIEIAKKRSEKYNIHYFVSDAAKLSVIQDATFDAVVSILAVQNMEDLDAVSKETSRVLKKGGRMIWVMNHPCFRIPRQSGWGFDEKRKLQYRRVDRYLSPLKIPIQMHPGAKPDVVTWTFHRPLSIYMQSLTQSGFCITGFEEWASKRTSRPGEKARAENSARAEIPMFLALSAVKS
jgi:ubiquinone/menaquinone biosynthesis C-methylase UbiE